MPASILKEMADFDEVSFISLDKEVEMHGHVETTTGAAVARQQTTSGSGSVSDGRGATIAVLDSGMFKDQESFKDKRVAFQMDFTGEGKTNDFYGHGTPTANIISLKVLNAQGRGTVSGLLNALNWILTNRATYNIRVVNMNLSTAASDSYKNDPLSLAVRKLVDAGIVVIDAAGDNGRNSNGNEAKP